MARGPWPGETVSGEARRGFSHLPSWDAQMQMHPRDLNQRCGPGAPRRHTDMEADTDVDTDMDMDVFYYCMRSEGVASLHGRVLS